MGVFPCAFLSSRDIVEVVKISATYLLAGLVGAVLVVTIGLYVVVQKNEIKQRAPETSRPLTFSTPGIQHPQREIPSEAFNPKGYIVPLESNEKGSLYSSRAQIKGVVKSWTSKLLTVVVADTEKKIQLPAAVYLYCSPQYFTDANGKQVQASTVWMNFPKDKPMGTLTDSSLISKKISIGNDIVALVNVGEGDSLMAYMMAGFGCKL